MTKEHERKTILIADETPYSREMFSYLLTEEGHEVLVTESLEEASDILGREGSRLDLVILDVEPSAEGRYELPSALRAGGLAAEVPLLVFQGATAASAPKDDRVDSIVQRTVATERILFAVNSLLYPQSEVARDTGRQLVRFPVSYRRKDAVLAQAFNISSGGMFLVVEDDTLPPVGTSLRVMLALPGDEPQEIEGVVMWRNTGPEIERSHPRGIGVRFLEPQPQLEGFVTEKGVLS